MKTKVINYVELYKCPECNKPMQPGDYDNRIGWWYCKKCRYNWHNTAIELAEKFKAENKDYSMPDLIPF